MLNPIITKINKSRILYTALIILHFIPFSCSHEEFNLSDLTLLETAKAQRMLLGIERDKININAEDASIVAEIFNRKNRNSTRSSPNEPTKQIKEISTLYDNGELMMYIVNYQDRKGYTIISATKKYYPVIAYSDEGSFSLQESYNDGSFILLDEYKKIMRYNEEQPDSIIDKYKKKWIEFENQKIEKQTDISTKSLSDYAMSIKKNEQKELWTNKGYECHDLGAIQYFLPKERADGYIRDICNHTDQNYNCEEVNLLLIKKYPIKTVGPLVKTNWHQHSPFNIDAPNNLAGCIPIAIAQIAKYHEWPITYSSANIPLICNTDMEDNVFFKKFIKDIRDYSKVTYKDKATGATMGDAVKAFNKLNYSATLMDYKRHETIQEIENNRPVLMGGDKKAIFFNIITTGHAWVCDGYEVRKTQYAALVWGSKFNIPDIEESNYFFANGTYDTSDFFHMNWGWGEKGGNGWYIFDDIYNRAHDLNYYLNREIIKVSPNK